VVNYINVFQVVGWYKLQKAGEEYGGVDRMFQDQILNLHLAPQVQLDHGLLQLVLLPQQLHHVLDLNDKF
jgi:hypothetical protein